MANELAEDERRRVEEVDREANEIAEDERRRAELEEQIHRNEQEFEVEQEERRALERAEAARRVEFMKSRN